MIVDQVAQSEQKDNTNEDDNSVKPDLLFGECV